MSDKADIEKIIRGIFAAFENHQSEFIESVMDPDATVWDVFTPQLIRGTKERAKFHEADQAQMQARGKLTWNIEDMVVDSWDDTGIARYYLNFVYQPPNATSGRVRITDVLRRVNGKWRVVHHHEGMTPTGIPPITEPGPKA